LDGEREEVMAKKNAVTEEEEKKADTGEMLISEAALVMAAAVLKAESLKLSMNIAIVDRGGLLKMFMRMDKAWRGSIDISQKKARTACFFDMSTGALGALSQPGGPLYQIEHSNGGLITFPGGVPLVKNGKVVGAIGVSGDTVDNDFAVATAGAQALVK
jgi:uncharacterized protein GlcG (DUF336 family)